jgi:hypothetical protein
VIGTGAVFGVMKQAEIVPLRIEAGHMAGVCLVRAGNENDAVRVWQETVGPGAELDASELTPSALGNVAEGLVALFERRGLKPQAPQVRALVARLPCP